MSIIWCGGEDIDFVSLTASMETSGAYHRTDYARNSIKTGVASAGVVTALGKIFPELSSLWVTARCNFAGIGVDRFYWGLTKGSTTASIGIGLGSNSTKIAVFKRTEAGTITKIAEESGNSSVGLIKIDVELQNFGTSTSVVKVYVNSVLVIDTGTVDTTMSTVTGLDRFCIHGSNTGGAYHYISEIIVADEDTRLMSLKTLAPDAAGDASEWTNGYTNIDEISFSDADTVFTSTVDQNFQCNLTGMPTGDFICKGVKVAVRATDGIGGIGMQLGVKTNDTVDLGDSIVLGGAWETVEKLYQQNPVTSNRFTPAEIDALQLAVKSVSTV